MISPLAVTPLRWWFVQDRPGLRHRRRSTGPFPLLAFFHLGFSNGDVRRPRSAVVVIVAFSSALLHEFGHLPVAQRFSIGPRT